MVGRFLALLWRPGRLRLVGVVVGGPAGAELVELWSGRAHGTYGIGRYAVGLAQSGSVVLLTCPGMAFRTPVLRSVDGARTFRLVPELPGPVRGLLGRYEVQPDGSITVLESPSPGPPARRDGPQRVHRLGREAAAWHSLTLPDRLDAHAVTVAAGGDLLVAGAWHAADGPRPALLTVDPAGHRPVVPRRERSAVWPPRLQDFLWPCATAEPFLRVDATEEPWLLTRDTGGFESTSTLVTLVAAGEWRTRWLPRGACAWLRPRTGQVRLVTSTGRLLDTADAGRTWTRRTLMRRLRPLLPAPSEWEVALLSAAQDGDHLLVLVTMHDWNRAELQTLQQTALLHTTDDAHPVRELLRTHGPDEAIAAVATWPATRSSNPSRRGQPFAGGTAG
jgi:hypothetical protein